jgi:formylglycine-generating enzyme required for sulfatase activity
MSEDFCGAAVQAVQPDPEKDELMQMKNILHPDYWVEIPEGEYVTGITPAQHEYLYHLYRLQIGYAGLPPYRQNMIDDLFEESRSGKQLSPKEAGPFSFERKVIYLKKFYMARFPVTRSQYDNFLRGTSPENLNGMLDAPEFYEFRTGFFLKKVRVSRRCAAKVQLEETMAFCKQLGARLPTYWEWEKAARGHEGRLYPWGDEWDINAGFFHYGQEIEKECGDGKPPIDAYPKNVSSFGVWGMAGGIPELVAESATGASVTHLHSGEFPPSDYKGDGLRVKIRGIYPRHSSAQTAYRDHLLVQPGYDEFPTPRSLRLVMDELP